jgi:hypothetical protein
MNKLNLILTLAFMLSLNNTFAQSLVHGGIYTNTTWSLANSPYLMDGSVVVFPGVTLTIEPGVEVRVKENGFSGNQFYLETRGTINMIGRPGALITFKADSYGTSNNEWAGILVKNSLGGVLNYDYINISNALYAINYDSYFPPLIILNQCEFSYNTIAINVGVELQADSCKFFGNSKAIYGWRIFKITNCIFDSNQFALSVYASELMIKDCFFANNTVGISYGPYSATALDVSNTIFDNNIVAFQNASSGSIDSCTFINNDRGITYTNNLEIRNSFFQNNQTALEAGWGTLVYNCEINNNATGIAIGPVDFGQPAPVIESNRICNNTNYNIDNRTDLNMFIPSNCFCISDSTQIEEKIFDGYDDITKGLISYAIFDTTCTTVIKTVYKQPITSVHESPVKTNIIIFPNPITDIVNINNSSNFTQAAIIDLKGQLHLSWKLRNGNNQKSLIELPAGVYFVRISGSGLNTEHIRLIKL